MIVSNDVVHDSRVLKEGRSLKSAGHEVIFLGWDRSGKLSPNEVWENMPVLRVRTEGGMRAVPTDVLRNPLWWRRAFRLAQSLAFDVVHCHDLDTLPIGVRLKRQTGKRLVYDCHEVFGYMIEEDVPSFVTSYAFHLERRLAPLADAVIAVNPAVARYIDGVTGRASIVIQNCEDTVYDAYQPPPGPPFTVTYVGTLHRSRFVLESIEAIAAMPDARLVVGGSKALTETVRAMCSQHANTQFVGLVPRDRVLSMTAEGHAILSMFDPTLRINQVGMPNKIFEAMAVGRPSIVTKGLWMSDLVDREDCGIAVPYTTEGFRDAVTRLRDEPGLAERLGRNGIAAAKREYNWVMESRKLIAMYEGLRRPT